MSDPAASKRRRWFALAASAMGLVGAILIAEVGAYLYYRTVVHRKALPLPRIYLESIEVEDTELFWRYLPDIHEHYIPADGPYPSRTISTNAYGLRDDPMEIPKPPGVFRVISMGESTTFGDLPRELTYTERLEVLLNERLHETTGVRIEVVNAGHGSYTSYQSRRLLELYGDEWQPDMVLLYHESNDGLPTGHRHSENSRLGLGYTDRELAQRLRQAEQTPEGWLREKLLRHSWFFWLVHLNAFDRSRVPDEDRLDNLEAIHGMTERWNASLVLLHPIRLGYEPHECVLTRFAEREDLLLIELADAWRASGLPDEKMFMDPVHPAWQGHQVMARAIFEALLEADLVPGPDRSAAPAS